MEVEGVRPSGRPKLRYMDSIKRDIKKNGLTVNIVDRKDWRLEVSRATHYVYAKSVSALTGPTDWILRYNKNDLF